MKTLDDALAVLDTQQEEIQYCTIDPETREITVPDTYKILGVESDEDVERVYFKCPKIVGDNIDLSSLVIFVNYQNASGEKDRYYCDDVSVKGDEITFSWLIPRKCAKTPGTIQFIVCAKKSVEEDVTNEWNTTVARSQVLEGLEPDEFFEETYPDIINQILQELDEIKAMGGAGAPSFYVNEKGHLIAKYEE
jgi:hypothetical protein